jgi:hypothetical protein
MRINHLRRRDFITLLGGAAVAWPLAAHAKQPGKLPTIGFFSPNTPSAASAWTAAFVQRLRDLGWNEDRSVAIAYRWGEGRQCHGQSPASRALAPQAGCAGVRVGRLPIELSRGKAVTARKGMLDCLAIVERGLSSNLSGGCQ